jgi:hypothetical protein
MLKNWLFAFLVVEPIVIVITLLCDGTMAEFLWVSIGYAVLALFQVLGWITPSDEGDALRYNLDGTIWTGGGPFIER